MDPEDEVGWYGDGTVGCVGFDEDEWPFELPYVAKISVPDANPPSDFYKVRAKDCNEELTCFYDYECQSCASSAVGDLEALMGGARIIIK